MKTQQKYKYIYTIRTNGVSFEVKADSDGEAVGFAKAIARVLRVFILGYERRRTNA